MYDFQVCLKFCLFYVWFDFKAHVINEPKVFIVICTSSRVSRPGMQAIHGEASTPWLGFKHS